MAVLLAFHNDKVYRDDRVLGMMVQGEELGSNILQVGRRNIRRAQKFTPFTAASSQLCLGGAGCLSQTSIRPTAHWGSLRNLAGRRAMTKSKSATIHVRIVDIVNRSGLKLDR